MEEEGPKKRAKRDFNHDHACGLCSAKSFSRRDKLVHHWKTQHRAAMEADTCPFSACGFMRDPTDPQSMITHCWHVHGVRGAKMLRCKHVDCDDPDGGETCESMLFGSLTELWEHEWIVHRKTEDVVFDTSTGIFAKTIPMTEKKRDRPDNDCCLGGGGGGGGSVYKIIGKTKPTKRFAQAFTGDVLLDDLGSLFGDLAATARSSDEGD